MSICARIVVAVTLHEVDSPPNAKTCAKRDNQSLQYTNCAVEKLHINLAFVPLLLEKIFRLEISFFANLMLFIFSFGAIFLGQFVGLYYSTSWWDKVTHVFSGVMLFFYGTALSGVFFKDDNKLAVVVFGVLFALAAGLLWEIAEFTIDTVFGSEMQKCIPDAFRNGGDIFKDLNGTVEEIGQFYQKPSGYRYALMDTMFDIPSTDVRKFTVTLPYAKKKIEKANILELKQVG